MGSAVEGQKVPRALPSLLGLAVRRVRPKVLLRQARWDAGGRKGWRVTLLLGSVLALDGADKGAIGAVAPQLKHAFALSNTEIGLLASAFAVVAGIGALPAGMLADRVRRTSLLGSSVLLWSVAMAVSGAAVSFAMLAAARLFLGVVTATEGPVQASLAGDMFPQRTRGRVLGLIEVGELVGNGAGFAIAGLMVAVWSWRGLFWVFALAGLAVAVSFWRLPEPERGGSQEPFAPDKPAQADPVARAVYRKKIKPAEATVLDDAASLGVGQAILHVLRIRTYVLIVVASSLGYLFFAGLRTFAVVFLASWYRVGSGPADELVLLIGVGALVGVVGGGRTGDWLIRRTRLTGRILVGGWGYVLAAVALLPALLTRSFPLALPLLMLGALGLAAPNPPLDAARLDIVQPELWGRAAAVRTVARTAAEAAGPLLFGFMADHLAASHAAALDRTFLFMLVSLLANGAILLVASRSYLTDVASVQHSTAVQRSSDSSAPTAL